MTSETSAKPVSVDPQRALVERVRASPSLQNSPRLQELFRHLAERALSEPTSPATEQQVGAAVFGRPPDYDTTVDTIVRVQVSQLRRKLERYFLSEGRDEPVVIELPRGSYMPVFRPRAGAAGTPPEPGAAARPKRWTSIVLFAAAVVASVVFGWLAHGLLVRKAPIVAEERPFLDHFWRQFSENHLPTQIVISDVGVLMLSEALGRTVPLAEYRRTTYPTALTESLPGDEKTKTLFLRNATRGFTTSKEAAVGKDLARLCEKHRLFASIVSARDFRMNLQSPENVILLGHARANPWLELFDADLNFHYHFEDARRKAEITNRAPLPGEQAAYASDWGRKGYCVVAYLPRPGGSGNALLVFGGDLLSIEAGGHFVSDEKAMAGLHAQLRLTASDRLPFFEVLLQTKLQGDSTGGYEVVAHRTRPT